MGIVTASTIKRLALVLQDLEAGVYLFSLDQQDGLPVKSLLLHGVSSLYQDGNQGIPQQALSVKDISQHQHGAYDS